MGSRVYRPPPLQLDCGVGCEIYYGGPKEDLGKYIKECEAANNRTGEEVEEEAQNIDYDCNLFPDFSSIPTKHWHAFILKCSVEESKKKEPNKGKSMQGSKQSIEVRNLGRVMVVQ